MIAGLTVTGTDYWNGRIWIDPPLDYSNAEILNAELALKDARLPVYTQGVLQGK